MAERVIFLLRDHAATQQLMEAADTWGVQCKALDNYADASLEKLAFTAGALVVQERNWRMAHAVASELEADVAVQLAINMRMRFGDELMAAFWFSKRLQDHTAFMVLTCFRIKKVLNGLDNAERYSLLHAKAAKRSLKRDSVLGTLDLSSSRAAAVQEQDAVIAQVRAEVLASLL